MGPTQARVDPDPTPPPTLSHHFPSTQKGRTVQRRGESLFLCSGVIIVEVSIGPPRSRRDAHRPARSPALLSSPFVSICPSHTLNVFLTVFPCSYEVSHGRSQLPSIGPDQTYAPMGHPRESLHALLSWAHSNSLPPTLVRFLVNIQARSALEPHTHALAFEE